MTDLEVSDVKPPRGSFIKPKERETWQDEDICEVLKDLLSQLASDEDLVLNQALTRFTTVPKAPADPYGSPIVMVVARTAIRACRLIKHLLPFRQYTHLANLFAKNKKVEDQERFLKNWHCHLGVGTANRMYELAQRGSLHFDRTALWIVDMELDMPKAISILDSFETRADLLTLYRAYIQPRLKEGSTRMAFF